MSEVKIDIVEVLDLCAEFQTAVHTLMKNDEAVAQKFFDEMAPFSAEVEQLTEKIGYQMSHFEGCDADERKNNTEFQNLNLQSFELLADFVLKAMNKEQIVSCLPKGLKANNQAVECLEKRKAVQMSKVCRLSF